MRVKIFQQYFNPLIFSVLLVSFVFAIFFFTNNKRDGFQLEDRGTSETSHNVNLPLTTTTSCSNFCGPQSLCAKTRDQCTSDVDCPGCQPVVPATDKSYGPDIRGQNDAGKLGYFSPQYSTLTTDIGTQASFYYPASAIAPGSKTAQVAIANLGTGLTVAGKEGQRLFNLKNAYLRKQETGLEFEPKYPARESATGLFVDKDAPLAANAFL